MVRGRYCVGLARARQRGESFFETYCHPRFMNGWEMKRWKRDFEAQIKAIQIKEKLARNGYILTGYEEKDERIVLRIKQAV
jgi:hypothetical protein